MSILALGLMLIIVPKLKPTFRSLTLHCLLFIGGATVMIANSTNAPQLPNQNETIFASIVKDIEEKNKTFKAVAKIHYTTKDGKKVATKSILYLQKSEAAKNLLIGDQIQLKGRFQTISKPILPGDFDYNRFLANRGIYFSSYVKTDDWQTLNQTDKSLVVHRLAAQKRQYFSYIIEENVSEQAQGLIKAISLGQKSDLEHTTKTAFSKAGIMHILAVSGLHVGIVWTLIAFLLNPIRKLKPSVKTYTIILEIACIWAFAFITGFAPSVQRAAFMFSLMAISKINQYEKDSINLVIASAVILLLFNPHLLFEVGFQLSYSAVLGIILLYPKIYPLIYCKNKFANTIWQVEVVSFAAVIGTAPISIYYFHQFSLVFPITNLIAIPAAYILVAGSILLFIVGGIAWLGNFVGLILSKICAALVQMIEVISNWSFSALTSIYINSHELILLVLLLVLVGIGIYHIKHAKRMLIAGLVVFNLLCIYRGARKMIAYQSIEHFTVNHNNTETNLIRVGSKLLVLQSVDNEQTYPIQLNGFKRNKLVYKKEKITSSILQLDDFLPHSNSYAANEIK